VRVYRIPFSTNVERVALALGHKGVQVEWVDVDPADRSPVVEVSGQELVPVLATDEGQVLADSPRILKWIEEQFPEPPLLPADPHEQAVVETFCDWFNRVWKRPPNLIADRLVAAMARPAIATERPDRASPGPAGHNQGAPELVAELEGSMDLFEALLHDRDYLFGRFSLADVTAFPFLKYALGLPEGDDEVFHRVLHDHLPLAGHPRVAEWVRGVDAHPRA
jgi:glutathione S-transferase